MIRRGFDLRAELEARGALLRGHFRLSSGRHSDRFIQKFRILEDPVLLESVGGAIAEHFRPLEPTIIVSAAVGGIVIGYEVARQLGVKAIFVEKEQGAPMLRRGFTLDVHDRALIVEDVVTTGLSVREVIALVRARGTCVLGVGAIVTREHVEVGMPVYALLDLPLASHDESTCPQCRVGEPIVDPGSRRA